MLGVALRLSVINTVLLSSYCSHVQLTMSKNQIVHILELTKNGILLDINATFREKNDEYVHRRLYMMNHGI